MDLGLNGSRVLITGGSRGIGLAIAEALAAEGAAIGLVARGADGLAAAADRLAGPGATVATAVADVTDPAALSRAVDEIASALGGLDHLVANAGGTVGGGNLTNSQPGEFTATFALNAGHAAELIRAGLRHLRAAGGGRFVIITSITGMRPAPRTAYAVGQGGRDPAGRDRRRRAGAGRYPGERGQPRARSCSPAALGHLPAAEPRALRHVPGHPVPVRAAGPPGGGRRRGRLPAVPAGGVGHRRQRRRRRRPAVPSARRFS